MEWVNLGCWLVSVALWWWIGFVMGQMSIYKRWKEDARKTTEQLKKQNESLEKGNRLITEFLKKV